MTIQPFYVISLLVEQPTWGGKYIASFKKVNLPEIKIGQSYELAKDSVLLTQPVKKLPFLLATAGDINHPQWHGASATNINIQQLIKTDPTAILGKKIVAKVGARMPILNKFTQAKENSYQVHIAPGNEFGHWQPKPESWYFFEPGKATLGLKNGIEVKKYQQRCQDINLKAAQLSQQIKNQQLTVSEARKQLTNFINQDHPNHYVNTVYPPQDGVVDLSRGGIHHSWENNPNLPAGNIVYEVQLDQRDEVSSIRAFDQGKIKDDGSIRQLAIQDYFTALDTQVKHNQPQQYMTASQAIQESGAEIMHIFDNPSYKLTQIKFSKQYRGNETQLNNQFHHLFVRAGQITIIWNNQKWPLSRGQSIFIPASCRNYQLMASQVATVLKTTA